MSGESIRAFRPSRMVGRDQTDEQTSMEKEAKMMKYTLRAKAGLPLFDGPAGAPTLTPKKTQ